MQTELNSIIVILYLFIFAILLFICTKIPRQNKSNNDHIIQAEAMRKKLQVRRRVVPKKRTELELEQLSRTLHEEWRKDEVSRRSVKPISGVSYAVRGVKESSMIKEEEVTVRRGGEFVGNRMRFKVKVVNESSYMITDVLVYLLSYPKEALKFASDNTDCQFPKIEPGGFRSPTFDFLPTQDCVKGEILAGVSYVDMMGKAHTLSTKPFVIRAVCDLLIPDQVSPEVFAHKIKIT